MNAATLINSALAVGAEGYMSGFGNGFETEALPGALPIGRNSPQRCAYGLYAEQLSGSPFTAPRGSNERSWLYRIRPTVGNWGDFRAIDSGLWRTAPVPGVKLPIGPLRWDPIADPQRAAISFIEGMRTITTAGDAARADGMAAHVYLVNALDAGRIFLQRRRRNAVRRRSTGRCASAPNSGASRSSQARSPSSRAASNSVWS